MRRVPAFQPLPPVSAMNMTPLIDVLLVLLVMFIITIPVEKHMVRLDLSAAMPPSFPVERDANLVTIAADGTASWNGAKVSAGLRRELMQATSWTRVPSFTCVRIKLRAMGALISFSRRSSATGSPASDSSATNATNAFSERMPIGKFLAALGTWVSCGG